MSDSAVIGAFIGAAAAACVLIVLMLSGKPVTCGACGRVQPKIRTPETMTQLMWGGYTCAGCGAELNARGKVRKT